VVVANFIGIRLKEIAEIRRTLLSVFSDVSAGHDGSRV
jgi:hypothetical protein